MKRRWYTAMASAASAVGGLLFLSNLGMRAQEPVIVRSSPQVVVTSAAENELPPAAPVSAEPLTLDACIALGFQHQPAMDAAQASLAAAQSGSRAVDRLILPRLFSPDLPIRRQQACVGVRIAEAGVTQAEWETRYAITRNFFTVQYIAAQDTVITEVLNDLKKARSRAETIYKKGGTITKIDLETIDIQTALVKNKKSLIDNGREKAFAALREAMGVGHDYPLKITAIDLAALAVYPVKVKSKDDKGKTVETVEYRQVYQIDKKQLDELIAVAVATRGEMISANGVAELSRLEVDAQNKKRGWQSPTFAIGGDLHSKLVPQSVYNGEYRPGGFPPEMPAMIAGRKADRVQRAEDLSQRNATVVDKATSLVSLDVEAQYFKWRESVEEARDLSAIQKLARELPDRVLKLNPNEFTSTAVIQANMTAIMVRTQLNDALHNHALGLAGLERATAGAFRIYPAPTPK